jgi:hypothetical protein
MKSERIQTAAITIAAMLLGSGLTWYLVRQQPAPPANLLPAEMQRPEPTTKVKSGPLDDDALDKAIAAAKAARKAGTLKPLAGTPEEFARVLGKWNFAIHDFATRFPIAPDESAPEYAAYRKELDALTDDLANLLSDEDLTTRLDVETPVQRARYQANLAAGSLDLDAATTAKLDAILTGAYAELTPPPADAAALDSKLAAMNAKIIGELEALLTPGQRERLDAMGVDRVLLGHSEPGD